MRKIAFIAAAAATALISTVGIAAEPAQQRFTHEGRTYVYTQTARENGKTLIEGHEVDSHEKFRLLVDGDRVRGTSNGYPVSFRTRSAVVASAAAAN
ncbi:hypothetical protein SAMN05216382_2052 [Sphingomonas palmae]|uniref:Uncharacterized protein n=1 Tax=Sphingomonas palmae TaxID=1855283 RepID=A0A1H7Q875_9SPHN|nr:hypothetical protein [Sphingomonas palmae]SEL43854.1 hypothetical protein SAMN05216382_2052 [Sphingomonas palmae]